MVEFFELYVNIFVTNIMALPNIVKYPGLLILALLAYRALRSVFTIDPFKVLTSTLMFVLIAYILSRFGRTIARIIGDLIT